MPRTEARPKRLNAMKASFHKDGNDTCDDKINALLVSLPHRYFLWLTQHLSMFPPGQYQLSLSLQLAMSLVQPQLHRSHHDNHWPRHSCVRKGPPVLVVLPSPGLSSALDHDLAGVQVLSWTLRMSLFIVPLQSQFYVRTTLGVACS